LICTNNESLKLIDLTNGQAELYSGHTDIVISVDIFSLTKDASSGFIVSGAKDNEIRLWRFNFKKDLYDRLKCIGIFRGHTQNISSVSFAPKKGQMFVSCSADNTLKVWDCKHFVSQDKEDDFEVAEIVT